MRALWLVTKLGIVVAVGWLAFGHLRERMEGGVVWAMTAFAALGILLLLGALGRLTRGGELGRALARSRAAMWQDGARLVAIGEVVPGAETLEAPFTGRDCVAYEYRVFRRVTSESRGSSGERERHRHWETAAYGLAQRPFSVRTTRGKVDMAGVALLVDVDEALPADPDAQARAGSLLTSTDVAELGASPLAMMRTLLKSLRGKEASVSGHWRKLDAPADPSGWQLGEKCVQGGEKVCVAGTWDAASRSLSPASGEALELVLGGEEEAQRRWVGGSRSHAVLGALFGLVFLGMPALFWWAAGKSMPGPDSSAFPAEILRGDLEAIQFQLEAGVDPNMPDPFGTPVLLTTRDPATVRALLAGGADPDIRNEDGSTRLQLAALSAETEVLKALLAADADPNLVGSVGETPVLAAMRGGHWVVVDQLLVAGARDPRVGPGAGRALTGLEEPVRVVQRYLDAVQKQDREVLAEQIDPDRLEGIDLTVWAGAYPADARLLKGYANDTAATLEVGGVAGDGNERRWVFFLQRGGDDESWRILANWNPGSAGMRWKSSAEAREE